MSEILYIESIKDYVKGEDRRKRYYHATKISYLEESLPKDLFLRVHRSFIVNVSKVDAYSATDIELGKHQVPIGRNYKNDVGRVLSRYSFE